MFIGRQNELKELEALYESNNFQMPVIYGRRRVGKSTIIREFAKGKKCIYYTAIESSSQRNLELFSQSIYQVLAPKMEGLAPFQTYESAFSYINNVAKDERIMLVIDEYPYLAKAEKSISSILQKHIDEYFKDSKLFLVLCGSSMSFMEHQVLGYQSPLYGRRTAQFLIRPFDYLTSAEFVPAYNVVDKAIVYGVTGGIPRYLELFDDKKNLRDNIIELFLKESGYLFEEPSNLIKQELRDASRYNSVIEAIASGATKVSEIAGKAKLEVAATTHCLESLIELGIVAKESAITEENNKKKTYYSISDSMFRFWYRYVPMGLDAILSRNGDYLYDEVISDTLSDYMGIQFEQMCRQYLMKMNQEGRMSFKILNIGRWWGNNPNKKREEEIDILACNKIKKQAVFGECKFKNELLGEDVYNALKEKSELVKCFDEKIYYLFSKSGFTEKMRERECDEIRLITLEDMYVQ